MHHLPAEREHDETNDAGVKDDRPQSEFARPHADVNRQNGTIHPTARSVHMRGRNLSGTLRSGTIPATLSYVNVQVNLPDELVARIDDLSTDRSEFVAEAVRRALRESDQKVDEQEIARINEVVDELNREAEEVLEYQVLT
jgi:polyhydroxyalkanoate synthesis regulator phasin